MKLDKLYLHTADEVCKFFDTDSVDGLSTKEVKKRLSKFGLNELKEEDKVPLWVHFIKQFKDFMVIVLMIATVLSIILGEYTDAITIFIIIMLNAFLGFIQEYRAEQSINSLKKLTSQISTVVRNGFHQQINSTQIVPGDLLILEPGNKVTADARLIEIQNLEIDESTLTGESLPVKKEIHTVTSEKLSLGDRTNMVYSGTIVLSGRGKAVVCTTGSHTEIGKIASVLQKKVNEKTPLEKKLEELGKKLVFWCIAVCILVSLIGILKGESIFLMLMSGISLAVAIIPEGLPAIVTVALALGMQRMIAHNAIVRRLPAVETLGCINVICSDKTGTLTKNEMTVRKIFTCKNRYLITGDGYDIKGDFINVDLKNEASNDMILKKCLEFSSLCNNSRLKRNNIEISGAWRKKNNNWTIEGDPTEGALIIVAAKFDIWRNILEKDYQKINEIPFESSRAKMSVVYRKGNEYFLITKGAPDEIIKLCSKYSSGINDNLLDEENRKKIMHENENMTKDALRVLAIAYKKLTKNQLDGIDETIETDLTFVGLVGMVDPPRSEAKKAIKICKLAKIRPIMITGDHPNTALAIAKELEIYDEKRSEVLTGKEIDKFTSDELAKHIDTTNVYARVSPFHKLKIVQCLKKQGYVVAMTGDGVNDAPAVKEADIGVCMGRNGTDVTKESSDMILIDDNFATIVAAVEEGRSIYDNIRKFIRYLLACNTGEVLTMLIASLIYLPLPLLPVQILWVNLITDGLPALALGVDKNNSNIMCRPPRNKKDSIFSKGLSKKIIFKGIQIGCSTILVFSLILFSKHDLELARTMAFTTLVFSQMFHVFDCRSEYVNCIEAGLFENKYLLSAVACSVIMHISVIYHPFFNDIFSTVPMSLEEWGIILLISGWNFIISALKHIFSYRKTAGKVFKAR